MERQLGKPLHIQAAEAFESPAFLQKLGMARADAERIFGGADWHQPVSYTHLTLPTSDLV